MTTSCRETPYRVARRSVTIRTCRAEAPGRRMVSMPPSLSLTVLTVVHDRPSRLVWTRYDEAYAAYQSRVIRRTRRGVPRSTAHHASSPQALAHRLVALASMALPAR